MDAAGAVKDQTQYRPGDVFDILFFRTWRMHSAFRGHWSQHNAALKFFRNQLAPGSVGLPSTAAVAADRGEGQESMELQPYGMQIAEIDHPKGMDFTFDFNTMIDWSWLEMAAQLEEESMIEVVGNGLVRCEFSIRPNSYAHDVHHAHRKGAREQPTTKQRVYDFVIWRADGTGIRLHPRWKVTKIETYGVDGHTEEVQHPTSGPGGSDGKGTFKKYQDIGTKAILRFDPEKKDKCKKEK